MLEYFRKFIGHSAVYAAGNAINRGAAFLLIPLYTRVLQPPEYGTMEIFLVVAGVLRAFLGMMVSHATLRFYFEQDDEAERRRVVSTAYLFSLGLSLGAMLLLAGRVDTLSRVLFNTPQEPVLFYLVFALVFFELSKEVALAYIRAKERSLLYVNLAVIQLLAQVFFNFYFVVRLHLGITGIFMGNVIGAGAAWLAASALTLRYCGLHFHAPTLSAIVRYCLPFLLATAGSVIIGNADRIMLNRYRDLAAVGIYALALRFGIGLRDLVVEAFTINFGQSRFAIMKRPDAKAIYAVTLTYFVYVITFVSLGIALFSKEALLLVAAPAFREAYTLVPLILAAVVLTGAGYILQTGILITKQTKYVFYSTMLLALVTVLANRILIPPLGAFGAALGAVVTGFLGCLFTGAVSQKLYPVKYEYARVARIAAAGAALCCCGFYVLPLFVSGVLREGAAKMLLFLSFPFVLYAAGFYTPAELERLRRLGAGLRQGLGAAAGFSAARNRGAV